MPSAGLTMLDRSRVKGQTKIDTLGPPGWGLGVELITTTLPRKK